MTEPSLDNEPVLRELRRRVRSPYRVFARLEVAGITPRGSGYVIETVNANDWGIQVFSPKPLQADASVQLHLRAPNGSELNLPGSIIYSTARSDSCWEAGIQFQSPEALLSVSHIDAASYGS